MQDLSIVAVIPLYNGAAFIEGAIRSVLAQTLPPDEFVVVDDGSTDEGPEIVQRLAAAHPGIRLLSKPNGGQSSARNFGVARTTSALIALLDQDDAWYPNHLAELVKPFRDAGADEPCGWVYSDLDRVDETGELIAHRLLRHVPSEHPKTSLAGCLANDMHILPSASLIARGAFLAVGGFDERLSGYEDDDLFLRLFRAGYRHVFIDEPLSLWRNNTSSASYSPRMGRSRMIFAEKLMRAFPDDPAAGRYDTRDVIAPRFAKTLLVSYVLAMQAGHRPTMRDAPRDLARILPHLPPGKALLYRGCQLVMGIAPLSRFGWWCWGLVRPFIRRRRNA